MKDPAEVCPLSRGMMLQPLSVRLPGGIRFLRHPLPALPWLALRLAYPCGRSTGLPCSAWMTGQVRFSLFAGSVCVHDRVRVTPIPATLPVWPKPVSGLWLVRVDDVYQEFAYANHIVHPGPFPPDAGRYTSASRFQCQPYSCGIRCPKAIQRFVTAPHYLVGYCWWNSRSCQARQSSRRLHVAPLRSRLKRGGFSALGPSHLPCVRGATPANNKRPAILDGARGRLPGFPI